MTTKEYEKKLFAMQEANAIMGATIKSQEAEIVRLKAELAQSVKLPCKVGGTVYIATEHRGVFESKVRTMFIGRSNVEMIRTQHYDIPFSDWGKTVFLTREEAEAELERRGK